MNSVYLDPCLLRRIEAALQTSTEARPCCRLRGAAAIGVGNTSPPNSSPLVNTAWKRGDEEVFPPLSDTIALLLLVCAYFATGLLAGVAFFAHKCVFSSLNI
jgi:hypothetical protein